MSYQTPYKYQKSGYVQSTPYRRLNHDQYGMAKSASGLPMKNPDVQHAGKYAASLIDPWIYQDVRIPDLACYPTVTYTAQTEFLWQPVNSSGATDSKVLIVDLNANPQWQLANGLGGASPGTRISSPGPIITNASTRFSSGRVVSAGIRVKFAGNDANSQGQINVVSYTSTLGSYGAGGAILNNGTVAAAVNTPTTQRQFYSGPLRDGCMATYRPLDSASFEMTDVNTTAGSVDQGQFVVSIFGQSTPPPAFTVEITVNLEGTIVDNTLGLEQEAAYTNLGSLQQGLRAGSCISGCTDSLPSTVERMNDTAETFLGTRSGGSTFLSPPTVKRTRLS